MNKNILIIALVLNSFACAMDSKKRRLEESNTSSAKRVKISDNFNNDTITLVSSDNREIIMSKEIACLAGTIDTLLKEYPNTNHIPLPSIDSQTLEALHVLMQIQYHQNNLQYLITNQRNLQNITGNSQISPHHEMRTNIQRCIAHRKLMNSLPIAMKDMAKLFMATTYLDLPVILNAIIHIYIHPLSEQKKVILNFEGISRIFKGPNSQYEGFKNINKLIALGIPNTAINYLAKIYFILDRKSIIDFSIWVTALGLSVNDYLLNKKKFNPIRRTLMPLSNDIVLTNLNLTSLEGFENITHTSNNVHTIDLSSNCLESLPDNVFQNYTNARHLNLRNNRLISLNPNSLNELKNLHTLNLSDNCIQNLTDHRTFEHTPNLKRLLLSHCFIKNFDPQILHPLKKLEEIRLHNNPWLHNQLRNKKGEAARKKEEEISANIQACCPSLKEILFAKPITWRIIPNIIDSDSGINGDIDSDSIENI